MTSCPIPVSLGFALVVEVIYNHSTSLAESPNTLGSKSFFTALEIAPEYLTPQSSPVRNDRYHLQPKPSSTPKMNKAKRTKPNKLKQEERLTILNINCRSVNNKIPELHQVIDQVQPDIMNMPHRNMVKTGYSHSGNISMSPWLPNIQRRQNIRQGRRCLPCGNVQVLK